MGLRYRKSVKIAPGVKVNFNKKSASVTLGGKGFHVTKNSSGRTTTSVNLPIRGLSYTDIQSGKKNVRASSRSSSPAFVPPAASAAPAPASKKQKAEKVKYKLNIVEVPTPFYVCIGIFLLVTAFFLSGSSVPLAIIAAAFGAMCIYMYVRYKINPHAENYITPEQMDRWRSLVDSNAPGNVFQLSKSSLPLLVSLKESVSDNVSAALSSETLSDFQKYSSAALDCQKTLVSFSEFIVLKDDSPEAMLQKLSSDFQNAASKY